MNDQRHRCLIVLVLLMASGLPLLGAEHWAFRKPVRPKAPWESGFPMAQNPIDFFIHRSLRERELKPSPEAKPEELVRRLSLDLNGLPASVTGVDGFLGDERPAAVEALVDRLLASPRFGETLAVPWMDAARYGDSCGMHADYERFVWPWRHYVIDAYNHNVPFDRFTLEQLAGDLLPNATRMQLIASAFNRHHPTSNEAGSIPEELRVQYVADRVHTTATVWLGLSMDCARCHDHKYEKISQEDYYGFFAYFNNNADEGMQVGDEIPNLKALTPEENSRVQKLNLETVSLQKRADAYRSRYGYRAETFWERAVRAGNKTGFAPADLKHHFALGAKGTHFATNTTVSQVVTTPMNTAEPVTFFFQLQRHGRRNGNIFARLNPGDKRSGIIASIQDAKLALRIIREWPDQYVEIRTEKDVPAGEWATVSISLPSANRVAGVDIRFNGRSARPYVDRDTLEVEVEVAGAFVFGANRFGPAADVTLRDFRVYSRLLNPAEVAPLNPAFERALRTPADQRDLLQKRLLDDFYFTLQDPGIGPTLRRLHTVERELNTINAGAGRCLVMGDLDAGARKTYVLDRGRYDLPDKRRRVTPRVPGVIGFPAGSFPQNRLGLARWLIHPDNPLTARVTVNRLWQHFFGEGLVTTPADFGERGMRPSHPALLDWLAVELVESGWNIKHITRLIVTSHTYRQSSVRRVQAVEPALLARAPRLRLSAEAVRDQALALAGLLVEEIGGESTKPYQPPGIWAEIHRYNYVSYHRQYGSKLYRRSLYTYWHRSAPLPNMMIFDAPTRERCAVRRSRTNTPLQALVTLNDEQFVEAARKFAERILGESNDRRDALGEAFRQATGRKMNKLESRILSELLVEHLDHYSAHVDEAVKLLGVGDSPVSGEYAPEQLAAWTIVCQALLNLDELLNRG